MNILKILLITFLLLLKPTLTHAEDVLVISTDNIEWGLLNPLRGDASPRAASLWGDRTKNMATGMLVKFPKGFSSPPHIHNVSYRGVVIKGLMHNDDPGAEEMWLTPGSFWTQPAGENHITSANGEENLIYLEIDNGPYLVLPTKEAFDNGERPINIDRDNLVWLNSEQINWLNQSSVEIAFLWGQANESNGSFVKFPAGFKGTIKSDNTLKVVVVRGNATHRWNQSEDLTNLTPSSFFKSNSRGTHRLAVETELVLYINSDGKYTVE